LLDITYSFTAHNSFFTDRVILREKATGARFIAAISEFTRRYLSDLFPEDHLEHKIHIVHCGLSPDDFAPPDPKPVNDVPTLLFVAQLVERKGAPFLVEACRLLAESGVRFRCVIIGDGPQRGHLQQLVDQYALDEVVELKGMVFQEDLKEYLECADVFVLPCVTAANGDMDGVPVSLMEAMAMEIATVSTCVSGIPELIEDGVSGLLVPEKDAVALANALQKLLEDDELRLRIGKNGRQKVIGEFDINQSTAQLAALFRRYMDNSGKPFADLDIKTLFLVWGFPHGSHRSKLMGEQLGIDVRHVYITAKQGRFIAPFKYIFQMIMTFGLLIRHRYQLVFVQDPPIFAVLPVYVYGLFTKARFIIDSHTDALQASFWKWTLPLHRFLEHRAITTIVTNDELRAMIESWGAHSFTLEDPPAQLDISKPVTLPDSKLKVVMVSTADYDEPIQEVLEAAQDLRDVDFYITGDFTNSHCHQSAVNSAPKNVHFTGYLREDYFALLNTADVVMCLSTENNTFLSGDNEALWLGKPLITSDWPILRRYFSKGTIHIDNSVEQIRQSILDMRDCLGEYRAEMRALQAERRYEWWARIDELLMRIQREMGLPPVGE
jgi:glycosyltransferase involved in cell wall biosynthesis